MSPDAPNPSWTPYDSGKADGSDMIGETECMGVAGWRTVIPLERQDSKELVEALKGLEKAASDVARCGAQTGSQWTRLSSAIIHARAALAKLEPEHGEGRR